MVTHIQLAKEYQRQIANLQKEREQLFRKAVRTLKVKDDNAAWDFFLNDQQGACEFLEKLK